jgi:GT2 family glycosyltransferase
MGADPARRAAAGAAPARIDNRHDIVVLPGASANDASRLRELAAEGHRVFTVGARLASGERPYELCETEPRFFEVALPAAQFEGLDALRRDHALGATLCVAPDPAGLPLSERLNAEQNWPTVSRASADMAQAFPLLSIVVVTYGNREVNRLCLDSLVARTEWPRREILVVDNGSTDGTRELLAGAAANHPEIRPILFEENRGYPAAVNAGLAQASGRYLVLLNNDTVVTRGSTTALLRHLARDPRIGLVGPVTNAIANEGRVDVGYASLEDLPAWAHRWTREHDGETFPIPSLAFFCVAMRREVFERVGPLDERFGLGMFEDGDYNRRVRGAGFEIRCARDAFVHHWQMASFRKLGEAAYLRLFEENERKFEEKWGKGE